MRDGGALGGRRVGPLQKLAQLRIRLTGGRIPVTLQELSIGQQRYGIVRRSRGGLLQATQRLFRISAAFQAARFACKILGGSQRRRKHQYRKNRGGLPAAPTPIGPELHPSLSFAPVRYCVLDSSTPSSPACQPAEA